ncbi:MAG: hypothetical protein WA862_02860 [Solirubrobacterales bacterium]
MSARYYKDLDLPGGVHIWVDFSTDRGTVVNYRAVLLLDTPIGTETIRVYDGAHGYNEMHRYTRRLGKQTGTLFHSGSLGEGMRVAIQDMEARYLEMVEGWER